MTDAKINGLAELKAALDALPAKLANNIMRAAMRSGAKPIQQRAQENVRKVSGSLAESIRIGTRLSRGIVKATISAGVSKKFKRPFYAHMVEYGTKRHVIKARNGKMLAIGVSKVDHPGAAAKPYMRPALDAEAVAAVEAVREYIRNRLSSKHGIDVPAPLEEGDE